MRKKFVFATNNSHKLEEVTAILGEKVELLSMKDIKCDTDIPETADTLEGGPWWGTGCLFRPLCRRCTQFGSKHEEVAERYGGHREPESAIPYRICTYHRRKGTSV